MDYASGVGVHRAAYNMGHILAAVPGRGSRQVSRIVGMAVAMVVVQAVLLVVQEEKGWPVLASLLSEAARLAAPRSLRFLFLDYS